MLRSFIPSLLLIALLASNAALAQSVESRIIRSASTVFNETLQTAGRRIPANLLANSHGVAIVPNVIKGGFVVGARHGRGLLFIRDANGAWRAPVFISLTGGNIGWQVGLQSSDLILVFKTPRSIEGVLGGKLTIGADIAAAAGPAGREAAAATDQSLRAEIYTYSRSRGLFAGVSIDGSVLKMDPAATASYYRQTRQNPAGTVPEPALQLTQQIANFAEGAQGKPDTIPPKSNQLQANSLDASGLKQPPTNQLMDLGTPRVDSKDFIRRQLASKTPQLLNVLDKQWREYLSLPPSFLNEGTHPTSDELKPVIAKYKQVASDQRYQRLNSREDFQSIVALLDEYLIAIDAASSNIQLPPPPMSLNPSR